MKKKKIDGMIYSLVKINIHFVLSGSLRYGGPLPEVIENIWCTEWIENESSI